MMKQRNAIALMMTLLFIVAITASLAISLGYVNKTNSKIHENRFLVQSNVILEDVLSFLKNAPELKAIKDADGLSMLLQTASVIPLEFNSIRVFIEIKSARGKFNINSLNNSKEIRQAFVEYLARFNLQDSEYLVALLVDNMGGGINNSSKMYESDIFDEKLWLYRDKIASENHLKEIINFYVKNRHDPAIYLVPWEEIVRIGDDNSSQIDINYMNDKMWQLMVPELDETRMETLSEHLEVFQKLEDTGLTPEESALIKSVYKVGFYYPVLEVSVDIHDKNSSATIKFEYDLEKKKGKNFEFYI